MEQTKNYDSYFALFEDLPLEGKEGDSYGIMDKDQESKGPGLKSRKDKGKEIVDENGDESAKKSYSDFFDELDPNFNSYLMYKPESET